VDRRHLRQLTHERRDHPTRLVEALAIESCRRRGQTLGQSGCPLWIESGMDLGDDFGVDLRSRSISFSGPTAAGRSDRSVAYGPLVDPLFGLTRLDLLALAFGRAFGSTRPSGLADLLGPPFGLGAGLRPPAVLLASLLDRASPARRAATLAATLAGAFAATAATLFPVRSGPAVGPLAGWASAATVRRGTALLAG
jgi:hypothetical protein